MRAQHNQSKKHLILNFNNILQSFDSKDCVPKDIVRGRSYIRILKISKCGDTLCSGIL